MKLPHGIKPGTIFRKRWGHGRSAFGQLSMAHEDGCTQGEIHNTKDGKRMASVNLMDLRSAVMAPVFVSRIRGRG